MGRQYRRCCNGNTSKKGGKASFLQGLKLDFDHLLDFSPSADAFRELAPLFTIKSIPDRRLTQPASVFRVVETFDRVKDRLFQQIQNWYTLRISARIFDLNIYIINIEMELQFANDK